MLGPLYSPNCFSVRVALVFAFIICGALEPDADAQRIDPPTGWTVPPNGHHLAAGTRSGVRVTGTGELSSGSTADKGYFLHRAVGAGDDLRVYLASGTNSGISGLMIRENLEPDAAFVTLGSDRGTTVLRYRHRAGESARTLEIGSTGSNRWLRLVVGATAVYAYDAVAATTATPAAWNYVGSIEVDFDTGKAWDVRPDLGGFFVSHGSADFHDLVQTSALFWSERTTRANAATVNGSWPEMGPSGDQFAVSDQLRVREGGSTAGWIDFPIRVNAPGTYRCFVHLPAGNHGSLSAELIVGATATPAPIDEIPSNLNGWRYVGTATLASGGMATVRLHHPGTAGFRVIADAARAVRVPEVEVGLPVYPGWTKIPAGTGRIRFSGSAGSHVIERTTTDDNNTWNAGAYSGSILVGDGRFLFRFAGKDLFMHAGLTTAPTSNDPAHITYRFTNKATGKIQAVGGGVSPEFGYQNGIPLEIERTGTRLVFRQSGQYLHTTTLPEGSPLHFYADTSLRDAGGKIGGAALVGTVVAPAHLTNLDAASGDTTPDILEHWVIEADPDDAIQSIYDVRMWDDPDGDGLTHAEEKEHGTHPTRSDPDGDGLSDAEEIYYYSTNPWLADTDDDGLDDGLEVNHGEWGFDPHRRDSDNDGVRDGTEYEIITDALGRGRSETTQALVRATDDYDRDGVINLHESEDATSAVNAADYFLPVAFDRLFGSIVGAEWTVEDHAGIRSSRIERTAPEFDPAGGISHHEAIDGTRVRFQLPPLPAGFWGGDLASIGFFHRGLDLDAPGGITHYDLVFRRDEQTGSLEGRFRHYGLEIPGAPVVAVAPGDLLELRLELAGPTRLVHLDRYTLPTMTRTSLAAVELPFGFATFDLEKHPLALGVRLDAEGSGLANLRYRRIHDPDTDDDSLPDRWEGRILAAYPGRFAGVGQVDPGEDADSDQLSNLREYQLGTDPAETDSDNDGMPDGWEVEHGLNPLNAADGSDSADLDRDGLSNRREYELGSRPDLVSTAWDGFSDGWKARWGLDPRIALDPAGDPDRDGLGHQRELELGTDPTRPDSDGDGIKDGWEVEHGLNPNDPGDATLDPDGDGWSHFEEFLAGTPPRVANATLPGTAAETFTYDNADRLVGLGGPAPALLTLDRENNLLGSQ